MYDQSKICLTIQHRVFNGGKQQWFFLYGFRVSKTEEEIGRGINSWYPDQAITDIRLIVVFIADQQGTDTFTQGAACIKQYIIGCSLKGPGN